MQKFRLFQRKNNEKRQQDKQTSSGKRASDSFLGLLGLCVLFLMMIGVPFFIIMALLTLSGLPTSYAVMIAGFLFLIMAVIALFKLLKKKIAKRRATKCFQCLRPIGGHIWRLDDKTYCEECYNRKMAIIRQSKEQGKGTNCSRNISTKNTFVCANSTELYLKLSSKYPKETIDFKHTVLEFRILDNINSEIKLIGGNKNMIILAIHNCFGTPYVIDSFDSASRKNMGFKVSYTEVIALMSKRKQYKYRNLNEDNWYQYTVMNEGDVIAVYGNRSGDGPYHEETRFGIRMDKNGYTIVYQEISPMGGGHNSDSQYPFGFFKDKSILEIEELLRRHAKYIDPQKIKMGKGNYEWLIRTDEYMSIVAEQKENQYEGDTLYLTEEYKVVLPKTLFRWSDDSSDRPGDNVYQHWEDVILCKDGRLIIEENSITYSAHSIGHNTGRDTTTKPLSFDQLPKMIALAEDKNAQKYLGMNEQNWPKYVRVRKTNEELASELETVVTLDLDYSNWVELRLHKTTGRAYTVKGENVQHGGALIPSITSIKRAFLSEVSSMVAKEYDYAKAFKLLYPKWEEHLCRKVLVISDSRYRMGWFAVVDGVEIPREAIGFGETVFHVPARVLTEDQHKKYAAYHTQTGPYEHYFDLPAECCEKVIRKLVPLASEKMN